MTGSMSRQGNCWDNAPTESWFNSLKNERVFGERFCLRGALLHPGRDEGDCLRAHRGVLQPQASALYPRLHLPRPVLEKLDQDSVRRKAGHTRPSLGRRRTEGTSVSDRRIGQREDIKDAQALGRAGRVKDDSGGQCLTVAQRRLVSRGSDGGRSRPGCPAAMREASDAPGAGVWIRRRRPESCCISRSELNRVEATAPRSRF